MGMEKTANMQLETTAYYQNISNLGVQFWRQDKNTAQLQFQITKNNYPLALSEENVEVFITLESEDSFIVSKDLEYLDQLNGVVLFTIPTDFMRVATDVTGQVYVTTLDDEEVIVERKFAFKVENDLIASIPSEDKIREIKLFADMRQEVNTMMLKLNNDFANMNDYVTKVSDTTQEGINALIKLIDDKEKAYNDNHTKKMKELTDKGDKYVSDLTDQRNYIDTKYTDYQNAVEASGLVTIGDSKSWQKYKLTADGGYRIYLKKGGFNNVLDLATGYYETVVNGSASIQGFPTSISDSAYVEIDVIKTDNARMQIKVVQSSNGRTFIKNIHTNGEDTIGWKEVAFIDANNPYETISGSQAKATTAENNAKVYTDNKLLSANVTLFEGTANGVGANLQLNDSLDNYIVLYVYVSFPGGTVPVLASPFGTKNMPIQVNNVVDADGNGGGQYECILNKTSRTLLKITNDVYYDTGTQTGSGANANKITINKIIGVHK